MEHKHQLYTLFPITVMGSSLDREFTEDELRFVEETIDTTILNGMGNQISRNKKILEEPQMQSILQWVNSSLKNYVEDIMKISGIELYVTNSWLNVAHPGQFHTKHDHPNSIVSGVLYLNTKPSDKIVFLRDDRSIWSMNHTELNIHNSMSWWLPAIEGSLYLFPSTLMHEVPPNESDDLRISISFNTFFTGAMGSDDSVTRLDLPKIV